MECGVEVARVFGGPRVWGEGVWGTRMWGLGVWGTRVWGLPTVARVKRDTGGRGFRRSWSLLGR